MKCFTCCGQGWVASFHDLKLQCDRCGGSGECPPIMLEWRKAGQAMRAARVAKRQPLALWAKERGKDVVRASLAERGIIDPSKL